MARVWRAGALALLAAFPALVVLFSTKGMAAISQDSVSYLSAARSFAAGDGLRTFTGEPLTLFPPGLPVVLGSAQALGWQAESAAAWLNAVCAAVVVAGAYLLAREAGVGRAVALLAAGLTSVSAANVGVFAWLWTEPLFTVLVLSVLLILLRGIRQRALGWGLVVALGVLVSAASTVRYVGLVLVAVVAWGIWMALQGAPLTSRVQRVVAAAGLSLVGFVWVAISNVASGSGPLGERYPGTRTLEGALKATIEVLGSYIAPPESTLLTVEAGVLVLMLLLVAGWLAFMRRNQPILLLAAFGLIYAAAIVWSQAATRLDVASFRLLSPAFVPLVVLALYGARETLRSMECQVEAWAASSRSSAVRERGRVVSLTVLRVASGAIVVLVVAASLVHVERLVSEARNDGLGMMPLALSSELAEAAARSGEGVASNDPGLIYLRLGHPTVLPLPPSATEWPAERLKADTDRLVAAVKAGTVTQAAVYDNATAIEPIGSLSVAGIEARLVGRYSDGTLYRLVPAP